MLKLVKTIQCVEDDGATSTEGKITNLVKLERKNLFFLRKFNFENKKAKKAY